MNTSKTKKTKKTRGQENKPASAPPAQSPPYPSILLLAGILLVTFLVYSGSLKNDFINWDDNANVYENPHIADLDFAGLKIFFTQPLLGMYTPLVYLSYALDYSVGGLNPKVYHFTNLFLHLLNVALVFVAVKLLARGTFVAPVAALLFAIHPMNVDAVVHVSVRSNLLYSFFYLSAFILYLLHPAGKKPRLLLAFSLLAFILACLAKSAAVTLPLLLLLADYFRKRAWTVRLLLEKIPFFLIALFFGLLTLFFRPDLGTPTIQEYSLFDRVFLVSYSIVFYIGKLFVPFFLSAYYPYPLKTGGALPWEFYLSPIVLLAALAVVHKVRTYRRELVFGFLFFLLHIALVIRFAPLGSEFVADRYAYLAYIGFFFVLARLYSPWLEGRPPDSARPKPYAAGFLTLAVLVLIVLSFGRTQVWKNSLTLWNDVLEKQPYADVAYLNRGSAKYKLRMYPEALRDYDRAIQINPRQGNPYNNRATVKEYLKDYPGALQDYTKAIQLAPDLVKAYVNRGRFQGSMKDYRGAIADFDKAIQLAGDDFSIYIDRGNAKAALEDYRGAIADFTTAIQAAPNAKIYFSRATSRVLAKDFEGAISDYGRAIELQPSYGAAFLNRGVVKMTLKNTRDACRDWETARQLGVKDAPVFLQQYCR